jgi:hypothetical protein
LAHWADIIGSSHGTILVFRAAAGVVDEDTTQKMMKNVVQLNNGRPLIAVGTHSDMYVKLRKPKWTEEAAGQVCQNLLIPRERLYITSPLIYLSAHLALQMLSSENILKQPWDHILETRAGEVSGHCFFCSKLALTDM